jgi:integrase
MRDQLQSLLSSYLDTLEAASLSAATKRTYASLVRQFIYFVDETDADRDTTADISCHELNLIARKFLALSSGGKASSVNSRVVAIRHFLRVSGNLSERLERPQTRLTALEPLSEEQLNRFKAAARSFCARDRAVALIFADTGMRLKEAAGLNLDCLTIAFECFTLSIERSGVRQQLPLEAETLGVLGQYLLSDPDFMHNQSAHSGRPLFIDRDGKRLSMRALTACVKKVGWRAKLAVTPAILRATRLSRLAMLTNDAFVLAQQAGLASPESAKRIIKACHRDITSFSVEAKLEAYADVLQVPTFVPVG